MFSLRGNYCQIFKLIFWTVIVRDKLINKSVKRLLSEWYFAYLHIKTKPQMFFG
jgi:hypothetical protein